MDVAMGELINGEVHDGEGLEDEKSLDFAPSFEDLVVVIDANAHVDGHHGHLEDNPCLLHPV